MTEPPLTTETNNVAVTNDTIAFRGDRTLRSFKGEPILIPEEATIPGGDNAAATPGFPPATGVDCHLSPDVFVVEVAPLTPMASAGLVGKPPLALKASQRVWSQGTPLLANRKDTFWALTRSHHHLRQKTLQGIDKVTECIENAAFSCDLNREDTVYEEDSFLAAGNLRLPALGIHETVWIDAMGPSREEMTAIAEVLLLNHLTLEDLTTGHTPDKIEAVGDYFFAVISFQKEERKHRICVVLRDRVVLTVHQDATSIMTEAMTRLHIMRLTALTSEAVFYVVLDAIADSIAASVILLQDEVDDIDESVLSITEEDRSDVLRRLTKARRLMGALRHSAISKDTILKTMLSQKYTECFLLRQNYNSVLDTLSHSISRIDNARDVISQANNNVTSILSMSIAEHANDTNDFMKRLSMVGAVVLPINLLCAAFGMNVRVPYNADQENGVTTDAWWIILGCSAFWVILCLLCYYVAHKRKMQKAKRIENV